MSSRRIIKNKLKELNIKLIELYYYRGYKGKEKDFKWMLNCQYPNGNYAYYEGTPNEIINQINDHIDDKHGPFLIDEKKLLVFEISSGTLKDSQESTVVKYLELEYGKGAYNVLSRHPKRDNRRKYIINVLVD